MIPRALRKQSVMNSRHDSEASSYESMGLNEDLESEGTCPPSAPMNVSIPSSRFDSLHCILYIFHVASNLLSRSVSEFIAIQSKTKILLSKNGTSLCIFATLVLSLWSLLVSAQVQLSSTGLTVNLDGIHYFVSPYSVGNVSVDGTSLSSAASIHGFYPVTVIQQEITTQDIPAVIQNFTKADDVFQPAFLQAILLPNADRAASDNFTYLDLESFAIPSGPYFLEASTGSLYQTYRLYSDFASAFTESLLQRPDGTFEILSAQIQGADTPTIGVPSRLYYTKTIEKPLAGERLAVKDIFDLAGVKTGCGNRAYSNLYPPRDTTAPAIRRLIDAGAIIIGKQKTCQFANGERATADWVDYQSPFNGRGDGYQDAGSSSSGAGAAMSSYDWLDISIGSETGDSIRAPAAFAGVFGNRPTWDTHDPTSAMPLSPHLDTAGFLMRDPYLWENAQQVLYGENYTVSSGTSYPSRIYTYGPGFSNSTDTDSSAMILNFLDALAFLTNATVERLILEDRWAATRPTNITAPLSTILNETYPMLVSKDQSTLVRDPFFADYAAVHDGRTPFIDPSPKARWAYGDSQSDSDFAREIENKEVFSTWFNTHILPLSTDPDKCSDALFLYIGSPGGPQAVHTRNTYHTPPTPPFGFTPSMISTLAGVPRLGIPTGSSAVFRRHD